jgi:hypothetical protein
MKRTRAWKLDTLWCPNSRHGNANGWSFPTAVEKRLKADTSAGSTLHLFGGRSSWGTRLDIDPIVRPDVYGDAWLPPFARDSFDFVVLDPPYFHLDAQMKTALFRAAGWIARRQVIWFSTVWQANSGGLRLERGYLVRVGDSCQVRCLQYFDVIAKPGPVAHFDRGPAMKYNRWLAQPNSLGLVFANDAVCDTIAGTSIGDSPGPTARQMP